MSSSTGSSPTTSSSVPHSSQDTISPLSVSKSTWTSASHSGQVPVGTCFHPPRISEGRVTPLVGEHHYPVRNQANLPASAGICNLLFLRAGWSNPAVTKAPSFCFFCKVFELSARVFPERRVWLSTFALPVMNPVRREG